MAGTIIKCKYIDCAFLDENKCLAAEIILDSDKGCLTYQPMEDAPIEENFDEIDNQEFEDGEEAENEDEDFWMDEEDEDEADDYN